VLSADIHRTSSWPDDWHAAVNSATARTPECGQESIERSLLARAQTRGWPCRPFDRRIRTDGQIHVTVMHVSTIAVGGRVPHGCIYLTPYLLAYPSFALVASV
jgi:hypothetical protein